ncbi:MAG TPA: AzlC family ABC transporter permease [Coriobacteriia bacterium]|nr:AzlC family ABC transporter permease [Coriobacteriia bacterium]
MSDEPLNQSPAIPDARHSTLQNIVRGCRLGLPIFLGYAPVGAAFGVLARSLGFTWWQAAICSATAIAGAGQFIALSLLTSGANVVSTLIATSVVNLRYVLFSTTLAPQLPNVRIPTLTWLGFTLTDETFAVNIADIRQKTATPASMSGVGIIAWCGWVLGTVVGALAANSIGDPTRFGVDFAMPAMFSALFVALAEDRRHIVVGVVAAALALGIPLLSRVGMPVSSNWVVVIASIAAATLATVVSSDE